MINLATRIFNTPLAIMPEKAEVIMQAIGPRLGVCEMVGLDGVKIKLDANATFNDVEPDKSKGYDVFSGVAYIPIRGTLVHKSGWLDAMSGLQSYEDLRDNFMSAINDQAVKGIFLDVDSPGGEVSGLFDLVDDMAHQVGKKPIHAHCNELSASAAYALTTVADHISTPRTGNVGSVGVIIIHHEMSRHLDKEGVTVNIIRAGERKADANSYEALSKAARQDLQGEVDYVRKIFTETVARNLEIDEQVIWDTEAAVYIAPEALKIGLVDAVMSAGEAAATLLTAVG